MKSLNALFLTISIFLIGLSHSSIGQQTDQKKWTYAVGIGMAATPSYVGDNEYQLLVFPHFGVKYGNKFFASLLEGAGYNFYKTDSWRIGGILKTNIGRFEDGTVPSSITGKTNDLIGLGDVSFTLEPGAFIEYNKKFFIAKLESRKGIGGHKGLIGEVSMKYQSAFKLNKKPIYFSAGPEMKITDSNFNNTFFGINAEQSSNTKFEIYDAASGVLSYGLSGSLIVPIDEKLSVIALIRYSKLGKVASDSHLVEQSGSKHQSTVGFLVNYTL